ncbi:MAG: sulfatase-like hydrolase/transferase [Blastochloris sp.]|nr:sulfatase-like hydrolase/transferase [Blastochloris sp.]
MGKMTRNREAMLGTQRAYHAMVSHVDDCVGRVVQHLKATGLWENTVVIFSSDHGELLGDHGLLWKGPMLLDSLMHVPLIMAGGGIQGGRVDGLTSMVDLAPTLAEMAGGVRGDWENSGSPLLNQDLQVVAKALREEVYAEWDEAGEGPTSCLRMLRTATQKVVCHPQRPEALECYDLVKDPQECWNLAASPEHRPEFEALIQRLAGHWHRPRMETSCRPGW